MSKTASLAICADDKRDPSTLTVEELRASLSQCLRTTAASLRAAAVYVRELDRRDEDYSDLCGPLAYHLRLIAYDQTTPEVIARFCGSPRLLKRVEQLPLPDQEKLAAGEPIRMVVYTETGDLTHSLVDPFRLSQKQLYQVFGYNGIRSDADQVAFLHHKRTEAKVALPKVIGDLRIDKELGGVKVGKKFIPLADLVAAVKVLQR